MKYFFIFLLIIGIVFAGKIMFGSEVETFVVIPSWYDKVECNQNQKVLASKKEIIEYVLCDKSVKKQLLKIQATIAYKKWKIISKKSNEWIVKIRSQGMLPSTSCLIKVNALGNITFLKACHYNK